MREFVRLDVVRYLLVQHDVEEDEGRGQRHPQPNELVVDPDAVPIDELIGVVDTEAAMAGLVGGAAAFPNSALFRAADAKAIDERAERVRRRLLGLDGLAGGDATDAEKLQARARAEYGIEVVDVRVRRFSYPEAVRGSIAERIRSERAKKVADAESEGRMRRSAAR